jgi:hypothetical protein
MSEDDDAPTTLHVLVVVARWSKDLFIILQFFVVLLRLLRIMNRSVIFFLVFLFECALAI